MTDLNVLFSTYNSEDVIKETLTGYRNLDARGIDWEIIVVNNASIDNTASILNEFMGVLPLRVIDCPTIGKNAALNSALPFVTSEFIIISDDDAIPKEDFLQKWNAIAFSKPEFDIFGGTIEPYFRVAPPSWMLSTKFHFEEIFARRNLDEGEIDATEIFGPNMAVRRLVFDKGLVFNESIGPNALNKNYPMGSETEFCRRVAAAGHRAYFAAEPHVRHIVRAHQITDEYWIKRAYRNGLGSGLRHRLDNSGDKQLADHVKFAVKFHVTQFLRRLMVRLSGDTLEKKQITWQFYYEKGFVDGKKGRLQV